MIAIDQVCLGVLAGGRGSRLGGVDKASVRLAGESLLDRTLRSFPQPFAERLLSHNRGSASFPIPVVADRRPGHPGPLAGIEALAWACRSPWLLTVPVDCLAIPDDLFALLAEAAGPDGTALRDADGPQPLLGLWRVATLKPRVAQVFAAGRLAVQELAADLERTTVDLSPLQLGNLNSPEDFEQ